jgi:hypothetical protein
VVLEQLGGEVLELLPWHLAEDDSAELELSSSM